MSQTRVPPRLPAGRRVGDEADDEWKARTLAQSSSNATIAGIALLIGLGVLALVGLVIAVVVLLADIHEDTNKKATQIIEAIIAGNEPRCTEMCANQTFDVTVQNQLNVIVDNEIALASDQPTLNVTLAGPFGPVCNASESVCVHLSTDEDPLDVLVLNQNLTVFVDTSDAPLQVELYGAATGGNCSSGDSLCVVFPPDAAPVNVNVINAGMNITANVTLNVNPNVTFHNILVGPLGDLPVNQSLAVTISSGQGPLDVEFGTLGNCSLGDALCVTISGQQGPLHVLVDNSLNATCAVSNSITLGPTQPTLNATCAVSNSITLAPSQPTLNATCAVANAITFASTQPTLNTTCTVTNEITLAATQPTLNATCSIPSFNATFVMSAVNATIVSPLGMQPTAASVAVVVTNTEPIVVRLGANFTDMFGRLRVSMPNTRFDVKMLTNFTDALNFDNVQVSGSGTTSVYSQGRASITLGVSASTAGRRVRKSLRSFNYQPGKGELIEMTVIPHNTSNGVTKRWGYFSDTSGYFYEMVGANRLFVVIRTSSSGSPVDTRVEVTSQLPPGWSAENGAIYEIVFAWLGFGSATFSIYLDNSTHWLLYTDTGGHSVVTIDNPNLPITYEIANNGSGTASTLECVCVSIISEGGEGPVGVPTAVNRGVSSISLSTDNATHSLLAVRLAASYTMASAYPTTLTITASTGPNYLYSLVYRPTVAGAALVWQTIPNSPLQYAIPVAANTVTGGQATMSGYATSTSTIQHIAANTPQSVFLGFPYGGAPGYELHLCILQLSSSSNEQYYASLDMTAIY